MRHQSALRSRPIAIATLQSPRACLREVSQEASEDGVQPACRWSWPVDYVLACRSFPQSHPSRRGSSASSAHHGQYAPVWEPVGPGHVFLDLTGTQRLFGPAVDTAIRIEREIIRREQLTGVLGVGTNKLVSRVATTLVQPPQLCEVRPGLEPTFMAPLSILSLHNVNSTLPDLSLSILEDLNLQTLGQIARHTPFVSPARAWPFCRHIAWMGAWHRPFAGAADSQATVFGAIDFCLAG